MNLLNMIITLLLVPVVLPTTAAASALAPRRGLAALLDRCSAKEAHVSVGRYDCSHCKRELDGGLFLKLACGHTFHKACILSWLIAHWHVAPHCATCSTPIPENDINAAGFDQQHPQVLVYKLVCMGAVAELIGVALDPAVDLNFRYHNGLTPLHVAVQAKQDAVVSFLLEQEEVDAELRDDAGNMAFDYIADKGTCAVVTARVSRLAIAAAAAALAGVGAVAYACSARR